MPKPGDISVFKSDGTRYRSTLVRGDGVEITLDGGGWNRIGGDVGRIPHDIAHFVVEQELGFALGLWGVLFGGGLLQNSRVTDGRQPPHAAIRSESVIAPARESLRQIEIIIRAVADLSLADGRVTAKALDASLGERWRLDAVSDESLARAVAGLEVAAASWQEVEVGGAQSLYWPGNAAR